MNKYLPDFQNVIILSILCGDIVGLERQITGKPSGIRTSIFFCQAPSFSSP